jgi:hypothetical protein
MEHFPKRATITLLILMDAAALLVKVTALYMAEDILIALHAV